MIKGIYCITKKVAYLVCEEHAVRLSDVGCSR